MDYLEITGCYKAAKVILVMLITLINTDRCFRQVTMMSSHLAATAKTSENFSGHTHEFDGGFCKELCLKELCLLKAGPPPLGLSNIHLPLSSPNLLVPE